VATSATAGVVNQVALRKCQRFQPRIWFNLQTQEGRFQPSFWHLNICAKTLRFDKLPENEDQALQLPMISMYSDEMGLAKNAREYRSSLSESRNNIKDIL
jgi:hypothetical protein